MRNKQKEYLTKVQYIDVKQKCGRARITIYAKTIGDDKSHQLPLHFLTDIVSMCTKNGDQNSLSQVTYRSGWVNNTFRHNEDERIEPLTMEREEEDEEDEEGIDP